jgi:starch-binding outer membrane protein, SusD/RagB family
MKKIFKYIWLLVAATTFSCQDYLKEELVPTVSYDYYNTEQGLEDLVKAAYSSLRFKFNGEQSFTLWEYGVDEMVQGADGSNKFIDLYDPQLNSLFGMFHDMWTEYYSAINTCNLGIQNIPALTSGTGALKDDVGKSRRIGELRFLRGFYYFELVQQFGSIPLVLEGSTEVRLEFSRSSVADIYKSIISDMMYAESVLPATQTDMGRVTKGAAEHFLAKVYLTRGSAINHQRGQQPTDMDSAAYWAELVINSGSYKLMDDYADLWKMENQDKIQANGAEVIFAAQFSGPDFLLDNSANRVHLYFGMQYDIKPGMQRDIANGRPFRRLRPSAYALDVFDRKNDSRFYKSFKMTWFANATNNPNFKIGDTAIYITMHADKNSDPRMLNKKYMWIPRSAFTKTEFPVLVKHLDPNRSSVNSEFGSRDGIYARFAETYLIAAEAYGRKENYAKAAEYLNVVRKRGSYKAGEVKPKENWLVEGGTPGDVESTESALQLDASYWDNNVPMEQYPESATSTSSRFIHFMLNERTRELYGELYRWQDLTRTETLVERVKKFNTEPGVNAQTFHMLRPIPQNHINRIRQGGQPLTPEQMSAEQNPGY